MNAADDILDPAPAPAPAATRAQARAITPLQTFAMLLKREFWEHRGGFLWAPVITGAIAIVFTALAVVAASLLAHNTLDASELDGMQVSVGGQDSGAGAVGDLALLGGLTMAAMVFVFVVFFYALGSIYDERKDRSILFWKSLPVSDTQAVLSKLLWALVLAPALAAAIGVLIGLAMWIISWLAAVLNGIPGATAVLTQAHPLRVLAQVLSAIPVYALWALPTVGWLMLCSAWARSVPFVWAVVIPVLACVFVSFLDVMPGIDIPHGAIWYTVVARGLLSVIPGSWFWNAQVADTVEASGLHGPVGLSQSLDFSSSMAALATLDLWLGAAIGAAMVYGAIRLRRWRDEG